MLLRYIKAFKHNIKAFKVVKAFYMLKSVKSIEKGFIIIKVIYNI